MALAERSGEGLEAALDALLARQLQRVRASHQRARADAGPSLFGGDRSPDHWTFGHIHQRLEEGLAEACRLLLAHPEGAALAPPDLTAWARPRLTGFVDEVLAMLYHEAAARPANEFGLRPAPEALRLLEGEARRLLGTALTGLARGQVDARLRPRPGPLAHLAAAAGGLDRLLLGLAVVAVLALLLAGTG